MKNISLHLIKQMPSLKFSFKKCSVNLTAMVGRVGKVTPTHAQCKKEICMYIIWFMINADVHRWCTVSILCIFCKGEDLRMDVSRLSLVSVSLGSKWHSEWEHTDITVSCQCLEQNRVSPSTKWIWKSNAVCVSTQGLWTQFVERTGPLTFLWVQTSLWAKQIFFSYSKSPELKIYQTHLYAQRMCALADVSASQCDCCLSSV